MMAENVSVPHYELCFEPIVCTDRSLKRHAEQEASHRAVTRLFGSSAKICHRADGSPYVEGVDGYVSISHSRNTLVLAYCPTNAIGVDIEFMSERIKKVKRRFLKLHEIERSGDDVSILLKAWCAKEALFKAALQKELTLIDFSLPTDFDCYNGAPFKAIEKSDAEFVLNYHQHESEACVCVAVRIDDEVNFSEIEKLIDNCCYDEACQLLTAVSDNNNVKLKAEALYLRGKIEWIHGNRSAAQSLWCVAVELHDENKARHALEMAREIEDFFNPDILNP